MEVPLSLIPLCWLSVAVTVAALPSLYFRLPLESDAVAFQLFHSEFAYGFCPPNRLTFTYFASDEGGVDVPLTTTFTSSKEEAPWSSVTVKRKVYVPSMRLLTVGFATVLLLKLYCAGPAVFVQAYEAMIPYESVAVELSCTELVGSVID